MKINLSFSGVLFLILFTLKLLGKITWSWWWVTAPLWITFLVAGTIFAGIFILAVIIAACER